MEGRTLSLLRVRPFFVSRGSIAAPQRLAGNRSVKERVHIFVADEMATTAILDRLFQKAHIFNIHGKSYRQKRL